MTENKVKILKGAEELFMRYGLKSVTMDDISRDLGISKKTLYQAVDNKADLIQQIIHQHIEEEKAAIEVITNEANDAIDEMVNIARYVIKMLKEMSPQAIYDLNKYYKKSWELMESLHQQYIYNIINANIEKGVAEGLYREDINPKIVARLYVGKSNLIVDNDLFPIKEFHREELFLEYIKYHVYGIASSKGLKLFKKHIAKLEKN